MKHSLLIKTALIAFAVPLFAGCVERQVVYRDRPVYVQQPAPVYASPAPAPGAPTAVVAVPSTPPPQAQVVYTDPTVLPPPIVEVQTVQPDPTYIWIGGGYSWYGGRWVWGSGHWGPRPYVGAVWVPGGWAYHGHRRVWVGAHWH